MQKSSKRKIFCAVARKNGIHIHDLILFGSSGLGTASPQRDIDIAIVSSVFVSKNIFERALMTKDAELLPVRKFRVALYVITLTPDPGCLLAMNRLHLLPYLPVFPAKKTSVFRRPEGHHLFSGHSGRRKATDCGTGCRRVWFLRIFSRF